MKKVTIATNGKTPNSVKRMKNMGKSRKVGDTVKMKKVAKAASRALGG